MDTVAGDPNGPAGELETWSNCFLWAIHRWLKYGGELKIVNSPYIPVWRAVWCPSGDLGPAWHFHPTRPKNGLAGIWAAVWHKGKPKDLRHGKDH